MATRPSWYRPDPADPMTRRTPPFEVSGDPDGPIHTRSRSEALAAAVRVASARGSATVFARDDAGRHEPWVTYRRVGGRVVLRDGIRGDRPVGPDGDFVAG